MCITTSARCNGLLYALSQVLVALCALPQQLFTFMKTITFSQKTHKIVRWMCCVCINVTVIYFHEKTTISWQKTHKNKMKQALSIDNIYKVTFRHWFCPPNYVAQLNFSWFIHVNSCWTPLFAQIILASTHEFISFVTF